MPCHNLLNAPSSNSVRTLLHSVARPASPPCNHVPYLSRTPCRTLLRLPCRTLSHAPRFHLIVLAFTPFVAHDLDHLIEPTFPLTASAARLAPAARHHQPTGAQSPATAPLSSLYLPLHPPPPPPPPFSPLYPASLSSLPPPPFSPHLLQPLTTSPVLPPPLLSPLIGSELNTSPTIRLLFCLPSSAQQLTNSPAIPPPLFSPHICPAAISSPLSASILVLPSLPLHPCPPTPAVVPPPLPPHSLPSAASAASSCTCNAFPICCWTSPIGPAS
ncbi:unnamed protein product [Closterium sp. NIES-53]